LTFREDLSGFLCNFRKLQGEHTMADKFIPTNRDQLLLFPPTIQDWLPEQHLARFVVDIVAELCRRQDRLQAIARAKAIIEQRAAQRYAQEQQEYTDKVAQRQAKAKETGKKPGGHDPKPPT
jgi:nitrogenase subunit NifH